jgi:ketosteroid isomerase-like protein
MKITAVVLLFLLLCTCFISPLRSQTQQAGPELLMKLEADFAKATAERGWDGYISYYAEDSAELSNGEPIVSGRENIRKTLGTWDPGMSLTWTPVKADMSASGDMGYTFGTFVFTANGKDGKPITSTGKYASIWRKQKDGSWKVVMDMGNSGPGERR